MVKHNAEPDGCRNGAIAKARRARILDCLARSHGLDSYDARDPARSARQHEARQAAQDRATSALSIGA